MMKKGEWRSTAEEVSLREEEEEEEDEEGEDEGWRCRTHPWKPLYGVCPFCLRDRLLRLCPDCANVRPCPCFPSCSSSSSSFSSLSSSADYARSSAAAAAVAASGIGAVGRVSSLIESEPAFKRCRSVGFQLPRSRSIAITSDHGGGGGGGGGEAKRRGWAALWPFSRAAAEGVKLSRSRSGFGGGGEEKVKGRHWHFPSPMKAFRHRKTAATKVAH